MIEGFTQRDLPDRWAWAGSTAAHWAYGSLAAGLYGVLVGSLRRPRVLYGLPFGAAVWAGGYVLLPQAGLYEPIWKDDARTLAWDWAPISPTGRVPEPCSGSSPGPQDTTDPLNPTAAEEPA